MLISLYDTFCRHVFFICVCLQYGGEGNDMRDTICSLQDQVKEAHAESRKWQERSTKLYRLYSEGIVKSMAIEPEQLEQN